LRQHNSHDHDRPAHHLEHFHDFRLVRTPEISAGIFIQSHPHQLGHRVLRVLFSSPHKSHWILRIQRGPTQDDQKAITLTVFSVSSVLYLDQQIKWNYILGFVLIVAAVFVIFKKW
jgi:hypothetical protein